MLKRAAMIGALLLVATSAVAQDKPKASMNPDAVKSDLVVSTKAHGTGLYGKSGWVPVIYFGVLLAVGLSS